MNNSGGGGAAPTGCYKCGRPGHWSRDCPSNPNPNPSSTSTTTHNNVGTPSPSSFKTSGGGFGSVPKKSIEKPKKVPRSRPKLTPELLLSNDGIGYVLRHFPRAFKYGGRGHEFVHKVEQVGATKRVRKCIGELRERVANGGDPTRLHEHPVEHDNSNHEQEAINLKDEVASLKNQGMDGLEEDMLQEIYKQTTDEPSPACRSDTSTRDISSDYISMKEQPNQDIYNIASSNSSVSEDQRTRMEANRLKALERAAARARP